MKNKNKNKMKTLSLKTWVIAGIAIMALTTASSCRKEKTPASTNSATTFPASTFNTVDAAMLDGLSSFLASNSKVFKTNSALQAFGSCGTVTEDTSTLPYTKTWTFTPGCTGSDGHFRNG